MRHRFRTLLWLAGYPSIGTGARYAGVVMAGTYAVVRGVALARHSPAIELPAPGPLDGDLTGGGWLFLTRFVSPHLLRGNLAAVLAGGAWLLAARVVLLFESAWDGLGLPGLFRSPAPGLVFVLTATGVLTVVLVAVTAGSPLVRSVEDRERGTPPDRRMRRLPEPAALVTPADVVGSRKHEVRAVVDAGGRVPRTRRRPTDTPDGVLGLMTVADGADRLGRPGDHRTPPEPLPCRPGRDACRCQQA